MREFNSQQEYSRHKIDRSNKNGDSNNQEDDDQNDETVNCPLIFKTCTVSFLTAGILAFVISFAVEKDNSPDLSYNDFLQCPDVSNIRRLVKTYAYQKMILGLSISGLVISFGLFMFLLYQSYNYCRCFDGCCKNESEEQQKSSFHGDIESYEIQLKKRITAGILMPKSQMKDSDLKKIGVNKKEKQQQMLKNRQNIKKKSSHRLRKSKRQIDQFNQRYQKYIKFSQSDQCDCQCEDCGTCFAYCVGCLCCRSCFDAHHYHFYNSKNQQYAYWIAYMIKTLLFGAALAYVIRIYVSLKEMDYCQNDNAKIYTNNIQIPMIIGIIFAVIDVFGYIHLFVEGTLLDMVEDTLHEQRKSESSDSDSDQQHISEHEKKQAKKYKSSSQQMHREKTSPKNIKKPYYKARQQDFKFVEVPTQQNLFKGIRSEKRQMKKQDIQKQKQPQLRDTDSFFITLRTLGNRYMDKIQDENGHSEHKYKFENKKELKSEQSYQSPHKKPRIQVPPSIDNLPKKSYPKMRRQQTVKQQSSLRQSIDFRGQRNLEG